MGPALGLAGVREEGHKCSFTVVSSSWQYSRQDPNAGLLWDLCELFFRPCGAFYNCLMRDRALDLSSVSLIPLLAVHLITFDAVVFWLQPSFLGGSLYSRDSLLGSYWTFGNSHN